MPDVSWYNLVLQVMVGVLLFTQLFTAKSALAQWLSLPGLLMWVIAILFLSAPEYDAARRIVMAACLVVVCVALWIRGGRPRHRARRDRR
jgi:uncharacterized membrane protein HdeD (DUF308 family)